MIIKNFRSLATTRTRKDALEIINAGLESALVKNVMRKNVTIVKNRLNIQNKSWNLASYRNVYVVGAGKAAADMAETLEKILGKRITRGIVIDTRNKSLSRITVVKGTHPISSTVNIRATHNIINLLKECNRDDLVICLISGGGSALMDAPRISLEKQKQVNKLLLKKGATIQEINTVRKHISYVKGGQLGALAAPATMITLIISDVMTNDLEVIASGPTVRDSTTVKDAERIRKKYSLPALNFAETPKTRLTHVTNLLLATNLSASQAMQEKAQVLGYNTRIVTTQLKGEARDVGKRLASLVKPGKALIFAGETTVHVRGTGKGGRNQETVLGATEYLKKGTIVSCSTDGVDFITDAAGGIVDETTKLKAAQHKLQVSSFLKNNDSYNFLKKVNGTIVTGKTGTNIGDLILVLGNASE